MDWEAIGAGLVLVAIFVICGLVGCIIDYIERPKKQLQRYVPATSYRRVTVRMAANIRAERPTRVRNLRRQS